MEEEEIYTDEEDWEDYYDSLGLTVDELIMRSNAKNAAKAAQTVADVARLLEGTYFDALFETEDNCQCWSFFDTSDYSVIVMEKIEDGWIPTKKKTSLNPESKVKYTSSGEDLHGFIIFDPPD